MSGSLNILKIKIERVSYQWIWAVILYIYGGTTFRSLFLEASAGFCVSVKLIFYLGVALSLSISLLIREPPPKYICKCIWFWMYSGVWWECLGY